MNWPSYTTTDGGTTWTSSEIAPGTFDTATGTATVAPTPLDVSCTTTSNCVTAGITFYVSVTSPGTATSGYTPFAYTTNNTAQSWSESTLPALPSGTDVYLFGFSCAGSSCVAAGGAVDPSSSTLVGPLLYQSQDGGNSFLAQTPPTAPTGLLQGLFGAYCEQGGACYATGAVGAQSGPSYGVIIENTPPALACPSMPPPVLPSGATLAPAGTKTVVITYNTTNPLSAAVIPNLTPGVSYEIEISLGNALGEGCAVAPTPAVISVDSSSNCSGCGGPVTQNHNCLLLLCSNGPVQTRPRVFLIFWGLDAPNRGHPLGDSPSVTNRIALTNLFSDIAGSGYYNILHHYGVTGYGGMQGFYYDTSAPFSLPGNVGRANTKIGKEIDRVIKRGKCRSATWTNCWHTNKPYPQFGVKTGGWLNTQFVVVPAKRVGVTNLMSNLDNKKGGCAYHSYSGNHVFDFNPDPGNSWEEDHCLYINEQYVNENDQSKYGDTTANLTEYTSHEFAEAATDPFSNAWMASNGDEIGDICQNINNGQFNRSLQREHDHSTVPRSPS